MSKLLIVLFIVANSITGFCDYPPYWKITLNGAEIYNSKHDSLLQKRVFQLDHSTLKLRKSDTLTISYHMDTGESGENHLLFINSDNKTILNLKEINKASFTITKQKWDKINCKCVLEIMYQSSWSNFNGFEGQQKLIEIV